MEFAEFYESTRDDCLRIVLLHVGDRHLAHDLVAGAYTRAWMSWRKVRELEVPRAWVVRTRAPARRAAPRFAWPFGLSPGLRPIPRRRRTQPERQPVARLISNRRPVRGGRAGRAEALAISIARISCQFTRFAAGRAGLRRITRFVTVSPGPKPPFMHHGLVSLA
jgi:hypothetical protein